MSKADELRRERIREYEKEERLKRRAIMDAHRRDIEEGRAIPAHHPEARKIFMAGFLETCNDARLAEWWHNRLFPKRVGGIEGARIDPFEDLVP